MSDNKNTNHVFIFPEGSINKDKDKNKTKKTNFLFFILSPHYNYNKISSNFMLNIFLIKKAILNNYMM